MNRVCVRLVILTLIGALGGCSAEHPHREVEFCLSQASELDEMKAVMRSVAATHGLKFEDSSTSVRNDLRALGSPLADQPIAWTLIEDDRWPPSSGIVMVNNVGSTDPRNVHASFFRNDSLFGSDSKTEAVADDLVSAIEEKWTLLDSTDGKTDCAT